MDSCAKPAPYVSRDDHLASFMGTGQAVREKDSPIDANRATTDIDIEFAGGGGSFDHMSSFPPSNSGDQNAQRRSQRVIVKVSVMVLADGTGNKPVSQETRTVTVNTHGAMILLGFTVSIGQLLNLSNSRTGEEVASGGLCEPS